MASSPRAIRQALRRRLLVLLAREQMAVECRAGRSPSSDLARRPLALQEEMRGLAVAIHGIAPSASQRAEGDTVVAQVKQRVARKAEEEIDTLVRALEQLRRQNLTERFVIFAQYRETLEFLREELGKVYSAPRIATIKGGPLEDKIAAIEAFWDEDGARFLICTSAGGEGIIPATWPR